VTGKQRELTMLDWSAPSTEPARAVHPAFALKSPPVDAGGLGAIDRGAARVSVDAKRMINSPADVNQLLPLKYKWVWEKYLA
jgi:ribonucleoside-diphosphate reductase beta chain